MRSLGLFQSQVEKGKCNSGKLLGTPGETPTLIHHRHRKGIHSLQFTSHTSISRQNNPNLEIFHSNTTSICDIQPLSQSFHELNTSWQAGRQMPPHETLMAWLKKNTDRLWGKHFRMKQA